MSTSCIRFESSPYADGSDSAEEQNQPDHYARASARSKSGACVHCKSLKVRCEFASGRNACIRCESGGYACQPRSRKKRKPAPTQEDLQKKSQDQDREIKTLLHQFDQLKSEAKIRQMMSQQGQPALTSTPAQPPMDPESASHSPYGESNAPSAESAACKFFGGQNDRFVPPPDIVRHCALYPEEIIELFQIYWERVNPFFSLLDPQYHTPTRLIWASPFLFTVICAVASRFYLKRPRLYAMAMEFARESAGKALIDGSKTIDICQAYLILAVYPVPKKKWVEDRSWMLIGLACRLALELELYRDCDPKMGQLEKLNRTRTWLTCFCVEGSHAIQFGKMPMLRLEDYTARNSGSWYKISTRTLPYDIHLCAYVQIIVIVARWQEACRKENAQHVLLSVEYEKKVEAEMDHWVAIYARESEPTDISRYRCQTTPLIAAYLRLVILSFGFQRAFKGGISRNQPIVTSSMNVAKLVLSIMVDRLYPAGHLRFAMEAHFLYVAFAAAFLINFLRPRFLPLIAESEQREIIATVDQLINVLGSSHVAIDCRHTPAIYAKFLSHQLDRYRPAEPSLAPNSPSDDIRIIPQYSENREQTPPHAQYSWPDCVPANRSPGASTPGSDQYSGTVYQHHGEADMDFSIPYFMSTVTTGGTHFAGGFNSTQGHSYSALSGWDYQGPTNASQNQPYSWYNTRY